MNIHWSMILGGALSWVIVLGLFALTILKSIEFNEIYRLIKYPVSDPPKGLIEAYQTKLSRCALWILLLLTGDASFLIAGFLLILFARG